MSAKARIEKGLGSFIDGARRFADRWIAWLFRLILRTPNNVSLAGVVIFTTGCVLWSFQRNNPTFRWWGIGIATFGAMFDWFDGAVARNYDMKSSFGGIFDSVLDRVIDGVIPMTIMLYQPTKQNIAVCSAAMIGSFLVPYCNAKSEIENLKFRLRRPGVKVPLRLDVGFGRRLVRLVAYGVFVLVNQPIYGVWFVAALAAITTGQRLQELRKVDERDKR